MVRQAATVVYTCARESTNVPQPVPENSIQETGTRTPYILVMLQQRLALIHGTMLGLASPLTLCL